MTIELPITTNGLSTRLFSTIERDKGSSIIFLLHALQTHEMRLELQSTVVSHDFSLCTHCASKSFLWSVDIASQMAEVVTLAILITLMVADVVVEPLILVVKIGLFVNYVVILVVLRLSSIISLILVFKVLTKLQLQ